MNMKLKLATLALAFVASGSAIAGSNSSTFEVQADVIKECAVDGGNLVFPNTGLLTANVDATANVQIECTGVVPYTLKNNGTYYSGVVESPTGKAHGMTNGSNEVFFLLYSDATHTTQFAETALISGTSTGGVQQIPVYGRIFPQPSRVAGTYSSVLPMVLTF